MAGSSRTVTINVIGNTAGATTSFNQVAATAESTGKRISGAFSNVLGTLNQTGVLGPFGNSLQTISNSFDNLIGKTKTLGDKLMEIGGAGAGIGAGLTAIGAGDVSSLASLQAAITDTGDSYGAYQDQVEQTINTQANLGNSAADVQNALATLVTGTGDTSTALANMGLTSDLAAKAHESLGDAAKQVVKVLDGTGTKTLAQYGITANAAATATKALTKAQTEAASAATAVQAAQTKLNQDQAKIGATGKPVTVSQSITLANDEAKLAAAKAKSQAASQAEAAAQTTANAATAKGTDAQQLQTKIAGQAQAKVAGFSGELDVWKTKVENAAAAFGAQYGPAITGVSTAVAGMGGAVTAGSAILDHFKTSTEAAQGASQALTAEQELQAGATEAVAGAEVEADAAGAPLILVIGAIVLAVVAAIAIGYELYKHWGEIWSGIKTVVNDAKNALGTAFDWIGNKFTSLYHGFQDAAGLIGDVFLDMAKLIANPVIGAINAIIDAWDSLHFTVPSVSVLGMSFGGFSIGLPTIPNIPYLAQGGIVNSPTLAMIGEAGPEAVVPLSGNKGSGFGQQTVVLQIDGKIVAQATFPHTRNQLLQFGRGTTTLGLA